jgi:hypothetical protein
MAFFWLHPVSRKGKFCPSKFFLKTSVLSDEVAMSLLLLQQVHLCIVSHVAGFHTHAAEDKASNSE